MITVTRIVFCFQDILQWSCLDFPWPYLSPRRTVYRLNENLIGGIKVEEESTARWVTFGGGGVAVE